MMYLKGLTANKIGLIACALGLIASGGCASKHSSSVTVAKVYGYADLDMLVRQHPGWAGVRQYDLALANLQNTSTRLSVPVGDASLSTLPAGDWQLPQLTTDDKRLQRQRLEALKQAQITRLRERRSQARAAELFPLQEAWQREATADYGRAVQAAQRIYLRRLRQGAVDRDARRLNLTLQIKALQNTIEGWKVSPPPAPRLRQAETNLAQKKSLLAVLNKAQAVGTQEALADREKAQAQAQQARLAYVKTRTHQRTVMLQAQDESQITAFARRLTYQELALLQGPAEQNTALPVGGLPQETLPQVQSATFKVPGSAARSKAQLQSAETRLRKERARWIAFLYDDTRAATLDAAAQQHWQITFGKTRMGEPLTEPLARLLTKQVWKT